MSDQPPKEGNKKAQHTPTERRTLSTEAARKRRRALHQALRHGAERTRDRPPY